MGGGDDLGGSDDEYMDNKWMKEGPTGDDISTTGSQEEDVKKSRNNNKNKKRKNLAEVLVSPHTALSDDDDDDQEARSNSKKRIKVKSKNQLLLETGRHIVNESTEIQAAFLWTCFTHYIPLNHQQTTDNTNPSSAHRKFVPSDFIQTTQTASFVDKLKAYVSLKRMKKWKVMKCPLVLIICSSARRAVALLKEIESLHVRIAKLFAKHMDLQDQVQLLQDKSHAIAVGTPNRLLKLFETKHEQEGRDKKEKESSVDEGRSLSFHQTQLVIMDSWEDSKRFTVCTLNDTAPDLMKLMMNAIMPEIQQRSNIKLAFF